MADHSEGADLDALAGPYSLKPLLANLDLTGENHDGKAKVTCVEYWEDNLYIGTSGGEVQHYVRIPGEDAGDAEGSSFILASRQEPSPADVPSGGVKQILVLPRSHKACVLCNGTVTFHTLPELSPAQGHRKLPNCTWIGARDLDAISDDATEDVIMITMRSKFRLVKTSSEQRPQLLKDVEYPGCLVAARRSRFACVADAHTYALLDLENQQKIPLFPISSSSTISSELGQKQDLPGAHSSDSRSASASREHRAEANRQQGHNRATSLGNFVSSLSRRQEEGRPRGSEEAPRTRDTLSPAPPSSRGGSPSPSRGPGRDKPLPLPPAPSIEPDRPPSIGRWSAQDLYPNIVSPLPTEFLLTTGTGTSDRGVGVFVNCDGDVVRGTLEFDRYPLSLVVDGGIPLTLSSTSQLGNESEGYVLAAMVRPDTSPILEIQRWDSAEQSKTAIALPMQSQNPVVEESSPTKAPGFGVSLALSASQLRSREVVEKLKLCRLLLSESSANSKDADRDRQESQFAQTFSQISSNVLVWHGNALSWAVRNPLILRLDARVDQILSQSKDTRLDQEKLVELLGSIRNHEAKSEAEFLGLEYIRQKLSLILFADLAVNRDDVNLQVDENLLLEGGADPRIMLSMVPLFQKDIVEGEDGIWINGGLHDLMRTRLSSTVIFIEEDEVLSRPEEYDIIGLLTRYLQAWRQRKGFGSIADAALRSQTVDAALLHLLLYQDQRSSYGPGASTSLRAEIYSVIDHKVDCFDRAVELLEEYQRLYLLSRLYQSRNMRAKVLDTWRRILEGERDVGDGFADGELQIPPYLAKTKDISLFKEYACWLANRNPVLGVQVLTDDSSKVKLSPHRAMELLREQAPSAIKVYLEHLVFGKKNTEYANELISYYLDNVLQVLDSSDEARNTLADSYVAYRALEAPRPTYRQFITENAAPAEWWHDRIRLLELLGGSHGAGFSYDVPKILARIEPFEEALIPELIILDGRQGRHRPALHLLTHGLGDYHTAINYCLLGGSSIFHPTSEQPATDALPTRDEQCTLFEYLLLEFLTLQDADTSRVCTIELLSRFGSWFQVENVLAHIPDAWPVESLQGFLSSTLRVMHHDGTESAIVKALSGVENLRLSAEFIEKCERMEPHIVPEMDTPTSMT